MKLTKKMEADHKASRKETKVKKVKSPRQGIPTSGIYGIALLFVCVSISFMAYLTIMGTEGLIPKLMTIPAVLFVVSFLVLKAIK